MNAFNKQMVEMAQKEIDTRRQIFEIGIKIGRLKNPSCKTSIELAKSAEKLIKTIDAYDVSGMMPNIKYTTLKRKSMTLKIHKWD